MSSCGSCCRIAGKVARLTELCAEEDTQSHTSNNNYAKREETLRCRCSSFMRSGTSRGSVRVSSSAKNSLGNCSTYTVTTGHSAAVVAGPGSMQAGVDDHFGVGPPVMPSVYQPQFTNIVQPLSHLFHTMPKHAYLQCHTQMHH